MEPKTPRRISTTPASASNLPTHRKGTRVAASMIAPKSSSESPRFHLCQRARHCPGRARARRPHASKATLRTSHETLRRSGLRRPMADSHTTIVPSSRNTSSTISSVRRAGESMGGLRYAFDAQLLDDHRCARAVHGIARHIGNLVGDVLALDHLTENRVAIIQVRCGSDGDEELAAIGAGAGIGHREFARLGMAQRWMELVREVVAGPPAPVSLRASALNHELRNHAVEDQAVIVIAFFFFPGSGIDKFFRALGQPDEILHRLGSFLFKQPANDIPL